MNPAQKLALWADKLRDISAMGLHFVRNRYDEDNYKNIQTIAMEMLALATNGALADMEPLRAPVFARPTPMTVGDGAVIDENGRILLIQRADNGKWALPGGALEVGETPAAGVVREILEETAVATAPVALIGIHDSRLCGSQTRHHLYHILFLCRPVQVGNPRTASHAEEVLAVDWFSADELPNNLDEGHKTRIPEAFRVWRGDLCAYFDA
ncbi:MAG: NUDIX hydrolase N-terminal domain-containing protein [Anaerolineales bacterium]|nr:NUDIX hydrolase N-terminal domain-containing protein [Anaerolineales bacterium]